MSTLAIGKPLLGGKYRIERVLGQGGFGITYLACHTMLDKRVAIKEFFPQSFCNRDSSTSRVVLGTLSAAELVERFRLKFIKEARNISRLSHSAIVQIHDIFEENDTAYYVMDYIEGESLSALVRREGPLASARALHLVRCVGDALSYIHGLKMNHLDVKPANIMLSQATGQPTLIDFGLAKQYDEGGHQTTSTPVGISHGYAPMEQYNIGGVSLFSPETDIYALGATLYYLLSGETPTEAPKLINEELTFPTTIPANLVAPIRRAMSPAKRDRYSSVADFLQALETPAASAEEPETSFDEPAVEDTVVDEEKQKPTPKPTPKPIFQKEAGKSPTPPEPIPRSEADLNRVFDENGPMSNDLRAIVENLISNQQYREAYNMCLVAIRNKDCTEYAMLKSKELFLILKAQAQKEKRKHWIFSIIFTILGLVLYMYFLLWAR
ncbi:MAG: serine/threonine protein kinase [Alistipes sp.]|nr:serine/threonine protein kinase [Alistipes sp.]